ncbi:hypothetical protein BJY01DRAFT_220693 [Aspergillus pseudoustus]|uniref:Uncharacterized protein n=1 Tax=Aspergillus pseudoustus TaxID=1810923 RepID=A0ABR4JCC1_9EURO
MSREWADIRNKAELSPRLLKSTCTLRKFVSFLFLSCQECLAVSAGVCGSRLSVQQVGKTWTLHLSDRGAELKLTRIWADVCADRRSWRLETREIHKGVRILKIIGSAPEDS